MDVPLQHVKFWKGNGDIVGPEIHLNGGEE
jgi:hypothetical protein